MSPIEDPDNAAFLVTVLANRAPFLVVYLVGLVLAVVRWGEDPTKALLATLGFALFMVVSAVGAYSSMLPMLAVEKGQSAGEIGQTMVMISGFTTVLGITSWVLLLIALFRRPPPVLTPQHQAVP